MRTWDALSLAVVLPLSLSLLGQPAHFTPAQRLAGIGVEREDMDGDVLAVRTERMIQSQTFGILRDFRAVAGAGRIASPRLQSLFRDAERRSGFPASTLEAMCYLESWGIADAESPSGPKGIMQISEATARGMGLRIVRSKRYRTTTQTVVRKKNGKPVSRTVRRRTPYSVTLRDDRLIPEKAIPAAAAYLARLERRFGGRDWAVFAYHCGEGCVSNLRPLASQADGVPDRQPEVARMFFAASPAFHRELYLAIQAQMRRDYSPTYWFRIMRAQELLALYRSDPDAFRKLADEFKSDLSPAPRAPNRLAVWLKSGDLAFRTWEDIRSDQDKKLVRALDHPDYFGYRLPNSAQLEAGFDEASPAALGTLLYIAFETRRLHERVAPAGEAFQPLTVTSLVHPAAGLQDTSEWLGHETGHVFDIEYATLPARERECLRFVLDDLGWYGYLGFTEEGPGSPDLHVGCSPSAREFFAHVFQEALAAVTPAGIPAGN